MQLLSSIGAYGYSAAWQIVPPLFVLTIVVFFHELGHFLVARWCGVAVKVFSIGFGKEILGYTDRKGTRWRLSMIPLGGFVRFLGDENEAGMPDRRALDNLKPEERELAFAGKRVGQRAAIVAAGPIANFILAIVIFSAIFAFYGREVTSARVDSVVANTPAERAGFKPGDLVVAINGRHIDNFNELQRIVSISTGQTLAIDVLRDGHVVSLTATPARQTVADGFGNKRTGLGIQRNTKSGEVTVEHFTPVQAVGMAVSESWFIAESTLSYLVGVVAGRESADQLGGPIRVAEVSAQVATLGLVPLINLAAFLSISIGLINLFPVPILDGGHLLFFTFEAVRGRPLSDRVQEIGFRIGFVAIVALMLFVTGNDLHFWQWLAHVES
jgi:regulator of sigma E protease